MMRSQFNLMTSFMNVTRTVDMPDVVLKLLNDPGTSRTISTVSSLGTVHTIYMGSLRAFSAHQLNSRMC